MDRGKINEIFTFADNQAEGNFNKIIRLSANSFCIALADSSNIKALYHYGFLNDDLSSKEQLSILKRCDEELNLKGTQNFFLNNTLNNFQVPKVLFSEKGTQLAMRLLVENSEQFQSVDNAVAAFELVNISAWEKEFYQETKSQFGDYQLLSQSSVLLNILANITKEVLLFVDSSNFTIAAKRGNNLLGLNSFCFDNERDFCYYSVAFLRKLFPNGVDTAVALCGNITTSSPLYHAISRFLPQVEFLSTDRPFNKIPYHSYCDFLYLQ